MNDIRNWEADCIMLIDKFQISLCKAVPSLRPHTHPDALTLHIRFPDAVNLAPLFPCINAVARHALYYDKPDFIRFNLGKHLCAVHPTEASAALFDDPSSATDFASRLVNYLNDIHSKRDSIEPNHKKFKPFSVPSILKLLPGTNCRDCGFPTCIAFAAALGRGRAAPDKCPHLGPPMEEKAVYPVFDETGAVVSTVTIDIDTSRTDRELTEKKRELHSLQQRMESMESPSGMSRPEEVDSTEVQGNLTRREMEVLRLMAGGATNTQISARLSISPHTVKSHTINIFNKLGVNDRTQAAVWAARNGLL